MRFHELETVAPGIFAVEPPHTRQFIVVDNLDTAREEAFAKALEVGYLEGGMSFPCRPEFGLNAHMQLLSAAAEPASAASFQASWLFDLVQSHNPGIELACRGLATDGRGDLDVVDAYCL